MANSKISALTSATTPLAGTETLPVVQSSTTKQVSVANLTAARAVSVGSLTSDGDLSFSANALYLKGKTSGGTSTRLIGINSGNTVYIGSIDTQAAGGVIFINGTQFMGVDTSSNVTFNVGNLVQGTAAKGINFTANTPAAGMTSQLLNWYEEGTWTPNQGAGLTVVGAFSSSGTYTKIGRQVFITGQISGATSVSINAGQQVTGNLPYSAANLAVGTIINAFASVGGATQIATLNVFSGETIPASTAIYFSATYTV